MNAYYKGQIHVLRRLENKFTKRLNRYREKQLKAEGTDYINQGAKIKTMVECLQDVNVELKKHYGEKTKKI
jgi:hypothetical protein